MQFSESCTTSVTTRSGVITILVVSALCISKIVAGSINRNGCSAKLFTTYRTLNYFFVRACSGARSRNFVLLNCRTLGVFRERKCGCIKSFTAIITGYRSRTCNRTSRIYSSCGLVKVTSCGNLCLCKENLVTYRAMLTFGKTGCFALGSNCRVNCLGVRKLGDSLCFSAELFTTYRTLNYFFVRACSGARSRNFVLLNCRTGGVTESCNLIIGVGIATSTSICRVTYRLASRSSYNCIVGVTELCHKFCTTYCTSLCSSTSSRGTGSVNIIVIFPGNSKFARTERKCICSTSCNIYCTVATRGAHCLVANCIIYRSIVSPPSIIICGTCTLIVMNLKGVSTLFKIKRCSKSRSRPHKRSGFSPFIE